MEQKDYFERQLSQFGKALASALALLMNKKYDSGLKIEDVQQILKDLPEPELQDLLKLDYSSFIDALERKELNQNEMEMLCHMLWECWNADKDNQSMRKKSLYTLEKLEKMNTNYDLELAERIISLKGVQNS